MCLRCSLNGQGFVFSPNPRSVEKRSGYPANSCAKDIAYTFYESLV